MRRIITFSGDRYHDTTEKLLSRGTQQGINVSIYDNIWLEEKRHEFVESHRKLFEKKCVKAKVVRGVCWFIFKMEILKDALRRAPNNSIVGYCDADTVPVGDMTPLFDLCERDSIVLFAACGHSQRHWSKRDTQIVMDMDHDFWRDRQAAVARFMFFKKGGSIKYAPQEYKPGKSISVDEFIQEWFDYSADIRANTFDESVLGEEYSDMIEPRCEQSVLTNLAHKYNIPLHREADQWGNAFVKDFPNDTYPQIFESTGIYSYAPGPRKPGSAFRNVED